MGAVAGSEGRFGVSGVGLSEHATNVNISKPMVRRTGGHKVVCDSMKSHMVNSNFKSLLFDRHRNTTQGPSLLQIIYFLWFELSCATPILTWSTIIATFSSGLTKTPSHRRFQRIPLDTLPSTSMVTI